MPIPLGGNFYPFTQITGRNFYQFSLRARQGAPHTRTGMPIALAVSGTRACTPAHTAWDPPAQHAWHSMALHDLFEAAAMRVVDKDLMAMKVNELKEELEARSEATSGSKAWLRRRLHAAIVREYLEMAMADE